MPQHLALAGSLVKPYELWSLAPPQHPLRRQEEISFPESHCHPERKWAALLSESENLFLRASLGTMLLIICLVSSEQSCTRVGSGARGRQPRWGRMPAALLLLNTFSHRWAHRHSRVGNAFHSLGAMTAPGFEPSSLGMPTLPQPPSSRQIGILPLPGT